MELSKNDVDAPLNSLKKIVHFDSDCLNFYVPVHFHDLEVKYLKTDEFGNAGSNLIDEANALKENLDDLKSSLDDLEEMAKMNETNYRIIEGNLES